MTSPFLSSLVRCPVMGVSTVTASTRYPAVAARFEADVMARQRERDRAPFLRARDRGELPEDTDIDLAIDQLVGPVYYRVLVTRQPVPPDFTAALVNSYLAQTAAS